MRFRPIRNVAACMLLDVCSDLLLVAVAFLYSRLVLTRQMKLISVSHYIRVGCFLY
jgi:hypothetical protein